MAQDDTLERLYREYNRLSNNPDTTKAELKAKNKEIEDRLEVCRNWERRMNELEQDMTGQDYDSFMGLDY
jgi:hypothetical protein